MKKNALPMLMAILCLAVMGFLGLMSAFEADRSEADLENRALQRFPKWNMEEALDGKYFTALDAYFSDQLYGREGIYEGYVRANIALRLPRVKDVVLGRDDKLLAFYEYDRDTKKELRDKEIRVAGNYRVIRALNDIMMARGGQFLYVQMPAKRVLLAENYPPFYRNYADTTPLEFDRFNQKMAEMGIPTLDLRGDFEGRDAYFATDHHINQRGAEIAYDAMMNALNIPASDFAWQTVNLPMQGSFNREIAGVWASDDRIAIAMPEGGYPAFNRVDYDYLRDEIKENQPLVHIETKTGYLRYNAYMGKDYARTVIETNRPELPNLLMIGDSFTNILEPLMLCSFNASHYLDMRYLPADFSLEAYIEENDIDHLVMVYTAPLSYLYIAEDLRALP